MYSCNVPYSVRWSLDNKKLTRVEYRNALDYLLYKYGQHIIARNEYEDAFLKFLNATQPELEKDINV